jgi:hypothetical protein
MERLRLTVLVVTTTRMMPALGNTLRAAGNFKGRPQCGEGTQCMEHKSRHASERHRERVRDVPIAIVMVNSGMRGDTLP